MCVVYCSMLKELLFNGAEEIGELLLFKFKFIPETLGKRSCCEVSLGILYGSGGVVSINIEILVLCW